MRWLITAIGTALGITRTATLVCQDQDGQNGGNNNTVEQPQPVPQESKRKRSSVKAVLLAQSPKVETLPVPTRTKKSLESGTQQVTSARQSKPVAQKRKPKSLVAPQDTQVKSRKPTQKIVLTDKVSGQVGRPRKTPVEKSFQGLNSKHSVAPSTIQDLLSSNEPLTIKPKPTRAGKHSQTLVLKTRQPVQQAQTKKRKVAD